MLCNIKEGVVDMDQPINRDVPRKDGDRRSLYRMEISRRSPPRTRHDEFMIEVYTRLLDSATELCNMERAGIGHPESA